MIEIVAGSNISGPVLFFFVRTATSLYLNGTEGINGLGVAVQEHPRQIFRETNHPVHPEPNPSPAGRFHDSVIPNDAMDPFPTPIFP
jgi:hypothetical protein